jgi:hypothetical protein
MKSNYGAGRVKDLASLSDEPIGDAALAMA